MEVDSSMIDEKERFQNDIKQSLKKGIEEEETLFQIKQSILNRWKKMSFNSIEETYVHHKYVKYCLVGWLDKLPTLFSALSDEELNDLLSPVIQSKHLKEIPLVFSQSKYFQAILRNTRLLSKTECDSILVDFKQSLSTYLHQKASQIEEENELAVEISQFFSLYDVHRCSMKDRIRSIGYMKDFLNGSMSFDRFIQCFYEAFALKNCEQQALIDKNLQNLKTKLSQKREITSVNANTEQSRKKIAYPLTSITFERRVAQDRVILIVKGVYISFDEIKDRLKEEMKTLDAVEVSIMAVETLFVDYDFIGPMWRGKNLFIRAKTIDVICTCAIDVSGVDGEPKVKPQAPGKKKVSENEEEKNGEHGVNGEKGESGGNVMIVAESIRHADRWTIRSNGGNGSYGQDGGDGADGKNGQDGFGLSLEEFKKDFPEAAKYIGQAAGNRTQQIVQHIKGICTPHSIESTVWKSTALSLYCHYIKGRTAHGNDIYFSFYGGFLPSSRVALCFYQGTVGQPGQQGGFAGLGGYAGSAGFAGDIQIVYRTSTGKNKVQTAAIDGRLGEDGKNGKDGKAGKPGENKPDVGYIDWDLWAEAEYYPPNWYRLDYSSDSSHGVRSARSENDAEYVSIVRRDKPDPPQCLAINEQAKQAHQHRRNKRQEASRKHAVADQLHSEIFLNYQSEFKENSMETLQVEIDRFHEHCSEIQSEDTNLEREKISIVRSFSRPKHHRIKKRSSPSSSPPDLSDAFDRFSILWAQFFKSPSKKSEETTVQLDQLMEELKRNTFTYENIWNLLSSVEKELDLSLLEKIKSKLHFPRNDQLDRLKLLLIEKLRIALLEKISSLVENRVGDQVETTEEYLEEETKLDHNSGIHAILGEMNEFGFYQSDEGGKIRGTIAKELPRLIQDNPPLRKALNQSINLLIENCFDQRKYPQMRKYLQHLPQNPTDNFGKELLNEYGAYLTDASPPFNKFDVAIVADLRKISLHVHIVSDTDENSLIHFSHYNDKGSDVAHVLYVSQRFFKLSVQKVEKKASRCARYLTILHDVQQLNKSEEFSRYLQQETFRSMEISEATKKTNHETIDANVLIQEIGQYFPQEVQQKVRLVLKPRALETPFDLSLFESLRQRFFIETPSISLEILMFLCMSMTKGNNTILYQWIILAYPQTQWINELALIKFEEFIEKPYEKIAYLRLMLRETACQGIVSLLLSKLSEQNTEDKRFDLLALLEQVKDCHVKDDDFLDLLLHLPLSQWMMKLKHFTFIQTVEKSLEHSEIDEQFAMILYYLYSLNSKSESLVAQFLQICRDKSLSNEQILNFTEKFYRNRWDFDGKTLDRIRTTSNQELNTLDPKKKGRFERLWNWLCADGERKFDELRKIAQSDKRTLTEEQFSRIDRCFADMSKDSFVSFTLEDIQQWIVDFRNQTREEKLENLGQVLLVIERAITLCFSDIQALRDAQKLTIIAFLLNENNLLAQVSTGEGKSLIVAAIMIVKCLLGEKGDIITSSPVLAERDAKENECLYQAFGISVGHNAWHSLQQRRDAYEKQVVYGNVSSFQRDYLLDHFYGKRILGDRYEQGKQNIIVDEVDSMLLDKGNSVLYLSHQPPLLDTLESVYVFIWQTIIQNLAQGQCPSQGELRKAVIHNLCPVISRQDLRLLTTKEELLDRLWSTLIDRDYIDEQGEILSCDIQLDGNEDLRGFLRDLRYLFREIVDHQRAIEVPNYLKAFIKRHLTAWISSALRALEMEEGRNYILDVDRTATKLNKHPNIVIIDCDTGVDQSHCQWNEGLHQFLQLKHQCKISLFNLKAVFISNISFFNMYKRIAGLSGTLGSESERDFLKKTYNVDFLTVPVALPSQFEESPPILCRDRQHWRETLIEQAVKLVKTRSVLIICETIQDVDQIHQEFRSRANFPAKRLFVYKRSYEEFILERQGLAPGQIIVATNLAGRGTDIKINKMLNSNGGLHVILGYLPENYRIEQQAFGRTARKGQRGSGQLIFFDQWTSEFNASHSALHVIDLKNERDYNELCRVGEIRDYYETSIQFEEKLFQRYHRAYDRLKDKLARTWQVNEHIQEIVLNSLVNSWAFWLDEWSPMISERSSLVARLDQFIQQLDSFSSTDATIDRLVTEPSQLVKLGKVYAQQTDYRRASNFYSRVIREEPHFAHAAHYYQAHCLVKTTALSTERARQDFHRSLDRAEYLFQHQIHELTGRSALVSQINLTNEQQSTISSVTIDSYRHQDENRCHFYSSLIQSIHDIRGYAVTPETLATIDISVADSWTFFEKLLHSTEKIFIGREFNQNFDRDQLRRIAIDYQLNEQHFEEHLSRTRSITEETIQYYWKEKHLPSREDFWQLLIDKGILTHLKEIVVIHSIANETGNDLFRSFLGKFEKEFQSFSTLPQHDKKQLFFHQVDLENKAIQYLAKPLHKSFSILEKQKLLLSNQMGQLNVEKLRELPLGKYQCVRVEDFQAIPGLTTDDCRGIYTKLIEEKLIDQKTGILLHHNCHALRLAGYELYKPRAIAIIQLQCLYQLERLNLLYQIDAKEIDKTHLTLPVNSPQELLYELEPSLIIKPIHFNYHVISISIFDQLLSRDYSSELEKLLKVHASDETSVAQSLSKSLQGTIGKLNYLSRPDCFLNALEENSQSNFEHVEELDQFTINGLDHRLDLQEKKWTMSMLISTAAIFIFGIAQVVGGVFLELFSVGVGTHLASGLIAEGLGDIFYAVSAAKSGYFSWSDYLLYKIKSIAMTIATAGIGALLSRGVRFSRFGAKLVGGTGNVAQLSGAKLLAAAGKSSLPGVGTNLMKHVSVRIGKKLAEGAAFSLAQAGISLLSEKLLKDYCGKIVSELFLNIRESIREKKQKIREALQHIYEVYGPTLTQKWLADINETHNTDTWLSKITAWVQSITQAVVNGISNAVRKMNQANHTSQFTSIVSNVMSIYGVLMKGKAYGTAILNIQSETKKYIDEIMQKLEAKNQQARSESNFNEKRISDDQINRLIEQTTNEWTTRMESKIDTDVRTRIIEPLLNEGAQAILRKIGKSIQTYHRSRRDEQLLKQFQKVRDEYRQREKNSFNENEDNADRQELLKDINNQYNKALIVLMATTKNPDVVASIVEEGGPMDTVCLQAMANITGRPIRIANADGTTMPQTVDPQNSLNRSNGEPISIEFIPGDGVETFGHFLPSGGDLPAMMTNADDNNCLIYATLGHSVTSTEAEAMRREIANEIRTNQYIAHVIQNGYHRYYLTQLSFDGQRESSITQLKKLSLERRVSDEYLIGVVGVHGNGSSYGTACLSKKNERESEHLLPQALAGLLHRVMYARTVITDKFSEIQSDPNAEAILFHGLREPELTHHQWNPSFMDEKEMLAICVPYEAHHDRDRNWTSSKSKYLGKWKSAENLILKYKSKDNNQNDQLFDLLIGQYENILNDPRYPRLKQGFSQYLAASESRGYINAGQKEQLMTKWNLPTITSTEQFYHVPQSYEHHAVLRDAIQTSLSNKPIASRQRRYQSTLL